MGNNAALEGGVWILIFNDDDLIGGDPCGEITIKGLFDFQASDGVQAGFFPIRFPECDEGGIQHDEADGGKLQSPTCVL
jgi:hypothetical protein